MSWSGSRISGLKNTIAPSVWLPTIMGIPKAQRKPAVAAAEARRKLLSLARSRIQPASELFHTRPGKPTPGAKANFPLSDTNPANCLDGECQVSNNVNRSVLLSALQNSPNFQSRHTQTA